MNGRRIKGQFGMFVGVIRSLGRYLLLLVLVNLSLYTSCDVFSFCHDLSFELTYLYDILFVVRMQITQSSFGKKERVVSKAWLLLKEMGDFWIPM